MHIFVTAILALMLVPIFHRLQIPVKFAWRDYLMLYWVYFAARSVFVAIALYAVGQTSDLVKALKERGPKVDIAALSMAILVPAMYFFIVFFLVLSFNVIIATVRFDGSGDAMLARVDSILMWGGSVPAIAQWAASHLSGGAIELLEWTYFWMFPQIGACMIMLAVKSGLKESFKFVGALAAAYYVALLLFFLIPATGPYYGTNVHSAFLGQEHTISFVQETITGALNKFREHARPDRIALDYFIALPCMHLVQPLIILWFLRKWGRVFWILVGYDLLLIVSIILLEQHYLVDILAAIPVAVLAIGLVDRSAMGARGALHAKNELA